MATALVAIQAAGAVSASSEQPWLCGVPRAVRHTLVVRDGVATQHLEGHQQGVSHQIRVHLQGGTTKEGASIDISITCLGGITPVLIVPND